VLIFFAVSLHVWGVRSPEPQEPIYATLAARLVTLALASPPLPLAPPLRFITNRRSSSESRVTLRTSLLNVPVVPGPPARSSAAVLDPTLKPVGTSSNTIVGTSDNAVVGTSGITIDWTAHTPDVAPRPATAAPQAGATLDDAPPVAPLVEPQTAPMTGAAVAIPLRETRIQSTAPSLDRLALSASRVALPADRKEPDPTDPADEQRRQKEGVLAVVFEYTRALERLDVHATKAVYPSVDDRRLRQSFEDVETQRFQLASCGVSFSSSGHDANALCLGNSTFRPKVGSRVLRYTDQVWEFNLARDGSGWQILEARIQ
jgi:hypothetical protein